jgi:hypothetical protein
LKPSSYFATERGREAFTNVEL